jgi:PAS domain S-box-containing protein
MKSLSRRVTESILLTFLGISVLFVAAAVPVQLQWTQQNIESACFLLDTLLTREQDTIANELFEERIKSLRLRLEQIERVKNIHGIILYDAEGKLVVKAGETTVPVSSDITPPTMPSGKRFLYERHGTILLFTKPIRAVGETFGWVRLSYDLGQVFNQRATFYLFFGCLLLITLLCMLTLLRKRLNTSVIMPLLRLRDSMASLHAGKDKPDLPEYSEDKEVADLVQSFEDMAGRLYASYRALDEKNLQLSNALDQSARVADALRESEAKFRGIVTQAPVGIMMFNNESVVSSSNRYFATIMGAKGPEQINGINILRDVRNDAVKAAVSQAISQGRASYEDYYTSLTGKRRVYVRARLIRITESTLLGVFEDLTEYKEILTALSESEHNKRLAAENLAELNKNLEATVAERTRDLQLKAEELEAANRRLRELDALKSTFLSSVSHELRTPLTSILGFAKVTRKSFSRHFWSPGEDDALKEKKAATIDDNLSIIIGEGERLSRLVNDVLDLTRIESGKMLWNDRTLDPVRILSHALAITRNEFHRGVQVIQTFEEDLPKITVDPDKLTQVVVNLLHNAAKFTSKGRVELSASRAETADGTMLSIAVSDTGPGIPKHEIDAVFERFHQAENPTDGHKPTGSGLGLAICRQIVLHYGGEIHADSTPGRGTTFTFVLPATPDNDRNETT